MKHGKRRGAFSGSRREKRPGTEEGRMTEIAFLTGRGGEEGVCAGGGAGDAAQGADGAEAEASGGRYLGKPLITFAFDQLMAAAWGRLW